MVAIIVLKTTVNDNCRIQLSYTFFSPENLNFKMNCIMIDYRAVLQKAEKLYRVHPISAALHIVVTTIFLVFETNNY